MELYECVFYLPNVMSRIFRELVKMGCGEWYRAIRVCRHFNAEGYREIIRHKVTKVMWMTPVRVYIRHGLMTTSESLVMFTCERNAISGITYVGRTGTLVNGKLKRRANVALFWMNKDGRIFGPSPERKRIDVVDVFCWFGGGYSNLDWFEGGYSKLMMQHIPRLKQQSTLEMPEQALWDINVQPIE